MMRFDKALPLSLRQQRERGTPPPASPFRNYTVWRRFGAFRRHVEPLGTVEASVQGPVRFKER
jgi:hypothetical protein